MYKANMSMHVRIGFLTSIEACPMEYQFHSVFMFVIANVKRERKSTHHHTRAGAGINMSKKEPVLLNIPLCMDQNTHSNPWTGVLELVDQSNTNRKKDRTNSHNHIHTRE